MPSGLSTLRLYVDSADPKEWERYLATDLFYGVTTNPKLLRNAGVPFKTSAFEKLAAIAFDLGAHEIHMQVWGRDLDHLLNVGRELGSIDPRVRVKVPLDQTGILCVRYLIDSGVPVTLTAVHAAEQILAAVALAADYAAPYLGRMMDAGMDGIREVAAMARIVKKLDSPTRVLVASIRESAQLATLAANGLDSFTLLPAIIDQILENDLTRLAVEQFEAAVV